MFRQLIKVLANTFHVRIEMKQIGARQEAGRIGGTGPCGRELCCATWMKNFSSVSTTAARLQDISLNPQKLAGMCAKLKCCLNYEVDCYMEAGKKMPPKDAILQTADNDYYIFKQDIIAGIVTYSTDKRLAANLETISAERAQEIIEMNKRGEKPLKLTSDGSDNAPQKPKDLVSPIDLRSTAEVAQNNRVDRVVGALKPAAQVGPTIAAAQEQNSNQLQAVVDSNNELSSLLRSALGGDGLRVAGMDTLIGVTASGSGSGGGQQPQIINNNYGGAQEDTGEGIDLRKKQL